ncbi:hypothetical protein PVAND_017282 [Polypedilum vanderplanki]|uniref:Estradiol 17-beta-dehydrogenase 2 n=1 Tax=Polypedilum vanderplanki TaxID=319348 RepID=A0A9J6BIL8_POLVA|nr:hypothetical protein PVAND_017282 [Polypedilum vanderplanki]
MIEDAMLLKRPDFYSFVKFAGLSTFSGLVTHYLMNPVEKKLVDERNVLIATGCDSGLGYSIAIHCHEKLNISVIACVQHLKSPGAEKLRNMFEKSKRFHLVELEITKDDSIDNVRKYVQNFFERNEDLEFTALVNNCGIMIFGETEWLTNRMIESQINVNLLGTMKLTHAMLPLARRYHTRIINVTSHCGIQCLPTLAIYGATKAGLASFTECLRMEMKPHGVDVVNFIPGSFWKNSNLASAQLKHSMEMKENFSEEQLNYYGDHFDRMSLHLSALSGERSPSLLEDENIMRTFEEALLEVPAKSRYICEPWRYKWYHFLFKITPTNVRDWLVKKFTALPQFEPKAIKN